jgi:hypothetical protein
MTLKDTGKLTKQQIKRLKDPIKAWPRPPVKQP